MYKKAPKRSSPYKRRRYSRKSKTVKKVSPAVKSYVKKTIHSNIENKQWQLIYLNQTIASLTGFSKNLLPTGAQGTGQQNRIGNEIRITKGVIRGFVNLLPYNAITNPLCIQRVRIMVLSMKADNTNTLDSTGIWQYGNTSLDLQANLSDCMYHLNQDKFTKYYDKTFILASPSQSSLTNNLAGQYFSNDKFQIPFYYDFSKHVKSKLKYNDTTLACINRNMFLFVQSVNADGTATAVQPAECHTFLDVQFEDA